MIGFKINEKIERFGQEHTKGLAYDMWQAYAVGVYVVDKEV